jgi:hypothetical protein
VALSEVVSKGDDWIKLTSDFDFVKDFIKQGTP